MLRSFFYYPRLLNSRPKTFPTRKEISVVMLYGRNLVPSGSQMGGRLHIATSFLVLVFVSIVPACGLSQRSSQVKSDDLSHRMRAITRDCAACGQPRTTAATGPPGAVWLRRGSGWRRA